MEKTTWGLILPCYQQHKVLSFLRAGPPQEEAPGVQMLAGRMLLDLARSPASVRTSPMPKRRDSPVALSHGPSPGQGGDAEQQTAVAARVRC